MQKKSESFRVRMTNDENAAFKELADKLGESRSRIARKLIREIVNRDIDLLNDEQLMIKVFTRQLSGIANNLNQLTRAIHLNSSSQSIDTKMMADIRDYVVAVRNEFDQIVKKSQKRWINCVPQ